MPLAIGLIGCGAISRKHIHAASLTPGTRIAAVADLSEKAAQAAAERAGPGTPWYTDHHAMLEKEPLDAVAVLTPSGSHAPLAIEAARSGRHVIVEKPLALTLEDADAVIETCDRHRVRLFVVKQNRYNLPIVKLREAVEQGRFGRMVMGVARVLWSRDQAYYNAASWRGTWAQDGGVVTNQAAHHIDMLQWMLGPVESVMARGETRLHDIEVEDTAAALFRFKSGALGVLEATTCIRPKDLEGSISIFGEGGSVEVGGFAMDRLKVFNFTEKQPGDEQVFDTHGKNPEVWAYPHVEFLRHVAASLNREKDQARVIDGLEGRKSLELINAIYESMETGHEVKLIFTPTRCRLGREKG